MAKVSSVLRFFALIACAALLISCAESDNGDKKDDEGAQSRADLIAQLLRAREEKDRKPTCVESSVPLRHCFLNLDDYFYWKRCVEATDNPVKCYVILYPSALQPIGDPLVPAISVADFLDLPPGIPVHTAVPATPVDVAPSEPTIPPGRHFQFNYVIRSLTGAQIEQLQASDDIFALTQGTDCQFIGRNLTSGAHRDFRVQGSAAPYILKFEVNGDSPGCSTEEVVQFWVNLSGMTPMQAGPATLVEVATNTWPLVFTDAEPYELRNHFYTYFNWKSYDANEVATAEFKFIAESKNTPGKFLIGYFGHMELKRNE